MSGIASAAGTAGGPAHALAPLYALADTGAWQESRIVDLITQWQDWGIRCIQLRAKNLPRARVEQLAHECAARLSPGTRFWINDHPEVAAAVAATGVHLGQEDMAPSEARKLLRPGQRIGRSTHDLDQALQALADPDVDVIAVGPIFPTRSKVDPDPTVGLDGLAAICSRVDKPVIAIGGITSETASATMRAGASSVAMIGALRGAEAEETIRQLLDSLNACRIPRTLRKE